MTIRKILGKVSNDYSSEEKIFKKTTGKNLLSAESFNNRNKLDSVSLIIPAFNSQNTIRLVLNSINSQTFLKQGGQLEVIIVDDFSSPPLLDKILPYANKLNILYLRSFENRGAGASRDDAIKISKNKIIIFIDSDIIIPPDFISNHLLIHASLLDDNIIVSFRENVNLNDRRINLLKHEKKVNPFLNDHRTNMIFRKEWAINNQDKKLIGKTFKILEDTNNFKKLGLGKRYFQWTLPMMVLTCAMSAPSRLVKKAIPVPSELSGWGFNDTCMACKMIAAGAKVIPNLNSTVLHILEKRHTKKTSIKNLEYIKNAQVYNKLLNSDFYAK